MIPLYQPGTSVLHRMPAGAKLLALLALGIGVSLWRESPWAALSAWCVVVLGFLVVRTGRPGWSVLRGCAAGLHLLGVHVWRLKWLALLVAVPQVIFLPLETAGINTARILAIVLLAGLFTLTTRVSDVMELLTRGLGPLERAGLRRFGLTAERLSLAMALTMRSVPVVFGFYGQIREARRARGARTSLAGTAGMTTPLLVMSLQHAQETAEALAARGVR
ncbi:energy-coupling factor transporter transmembrane component T [Nesterenkonia flava]|uniref:Energy-coupling factor transporter transmembrane component T n=1 Tax=Nesterenkonia flava TaxID=469799 RepID=A0ABU1FR42_9MICC|nr:energy-coupling factor transporter transmembrane component T [Nesterenkonia flava]MDR5710822.1 energy-coupling factor transporter transmembrane component T [Nesterenkonia flava]